MIRPTYSKVFKSDEVTEFRIKDNDIIYFDQKFHAFKIHFEQYFEKRLKGTKPLQVSQSQREEVGHTVKILKLRFRIECKSMFRYLLRKLRTYQFVKVQVMQYDNFILEKDIEQRR
jgi:hypothetical protein